MMKRTTIAQDQPLQDAPVIGRNIFELAMAPFDVKARYLPKGLEIRATGGDMRPIISIKANGIDVGHFQLYDQEDHAYSVVSETSQEIKLGDGRLVKIENCGYSSHTIVSVCNETGGPGVHEYFNSNYGDYSEGIRNFLRKMNDEYPLFINQLANASNDLPKVGPVTLIDGVEVIGPFAPDERLVVFLAQVDAKLEVAKVEAEQERLGIETAAQAAARAEEERQRALELERVQAEESQRQRALDSIFSM